MIKFFRHFRQMLLVNNRFGKYSLYALGEIVLVVIGIMIALSINNWNAQRLKNEENDVLLNKLTEELDLNLQRIDLLKTIPTGFGALAIKSDSILQILDSGVEQKHLDYMTEWYIFYVIDLNLNYSVFEELKITGSLYEVGSDVLVSSIQRYYRLCDRESFYNLTYAENAKERRNACYVKWNDFKHLYALDPKLAIAEHQWLFNPRSEDFILFRQYVEYVKVHSDLMIGKIDKISDQSIELKELIELEQKVKR